MVWLQFLVSAALLTFLAIRLAKYGDTIALSTRLGGMFIGTLLLAGATSLPEFITTIASLHQGLPDLAAGNLLGSNMFNMLMLAVLDLANYKHRLLRKAAVKHALSGSLAILLAVMVVFFILADIDVKAGWVGIDSLFIISGYIVAIALIQTQSRRMVSNESGTRRGNIPLLKKSLIGFVLTASALVLITPWMVSSSARIAEITGLGPTIIGSTLVALVTSLPEMVTTLAAARLGAHDMAIGNLFGSNLFNMFALGLTDVFFLHGRFLGIISNSFLLISIIGVLMMALALVGNLARLERRLLFIEIDAALLIFVYLFGLWILYQRGLAN